MQLVDTVSSAACRRPTRRCRATSRRSRRRRKEKRVTVRAAVAAAGGRRRAITSPTTAIRIRIRCTSPRRCCRTARARASTSRWSTRSRWRWRRSAGATSSRIRICSTRSAIVQPGHTPEEGADALIAELERLKAEPITEHELQRAKNQFARDYILGRQSDQDKGAAARARRRHPQRHPDGGRRVRHLPEHHRGRSAARGADILHAREPPGADDHAVGSRDGQPGPGRHAMI